MQQQTIAIARKIESIGIDPSHDLRGSHWRTFASEIDRIGREIRQLPGERSFQHLRKMEIWGRCASALGYATAWIFPNPVSAFLISQGIYSRWSLILHPISHGAFDRCSDVPKRYQSSGFAKGYRRFLDWFDWITPDNWNDEHNKLHHFHLGSAEDPDVVGRNAAMIGKLKVPKVIRFALAFVMACVWKPVYYAVNTLAESRHQRGLLSSNRLSWNNWSPLTPEGKELWFQCLIPYAAFRFVLLPSPFLIFGKTAFFCVLLNSIFAEILTNLHSFIMIGPNHTGDDLYTFVGRRRGKAEYYLRQILGTVNYPAGNDFVDFLYGGMNYQVEHHLWPQASLLQCRELRPRLMEICQRHGIRYTESPLLPRVIKTFQVMAGTVQQSDLPPCREVV